MGNRIAKHVLTSADVLEKSTYYVLDAQGNTMSVYERTVDDEAESVEFYQAEKHIYGSSRLGVMEEKIPLLGSQNSTYSMQDFWHRTGLRNYELNNHLGNVLSVISDKIMPVDEGTPDGVVDYFVADIRTAQDYSPFGVTLSGRNFTLAGAEEFRYGFQGQEKDDEIKGEGNSVNYTYRMHDPRIGRFFAVDPLTAKYPQWSPYQFGGNQVISSIELEGLEPSEDLNTASTDKAYQGKDKGANSNNTIYNWRVKITSNTDNAGVTTESRQWYQDGTTYNGPTAEENAEMAEDVYGSDKFKVWKHTAPNTDYHLRKTYSDVNGFKAALYSRDIDGEVFYTLAFAGTEVCWMLGQMSKQV